MSSSGYQVPYCHRTLQWGLRIVESESPRSLINKRALGEPTQLNCLTDQRSKGKIIVQQPAGVMCSCISCRPLFTERQPGCKCQGQLREGAVPEAHFPVTTLSLQVSLLQSDFHCCSWAQKTCSGQGDSVDWGIGLWRKNARGVVCLSGNQAKYHNCYLELLNPKTWSSLHFMAFII